MKCERKTFVSTLTVPTLLAAAAVAITMIPSASWSGVRGSAHDFSTTSWSMRGDLCMPCHVSHQAADNPVNALSSMSLKKTTASTSGFQLYSSPTMKAVMHEPSSASKACLSCHDGTVALNSLGGKPGNMTMKATAKIGPDLGKDHPISFRYDSDLAKKNQGLYDPAIKTVPALRGQTIQKGMLIDGNLECSSCHDVHASKGHAKTAGMLLLVNNDGSALCLTCHNK